MSYLRFGTPVEPPDRKTVYVAVFAARSMDVLGEIRWFGRWRQYTFHPKPHTTFNPACMREISDKCEAMTKEHRERRR